MRLVSLALAVALAVAGLSGPAAAQDKLTVLLDWFTNPDHAALVIAKEKGFFAKAGLDVTLVEPADPSAPPRLVAAGQGDIAITYQPNLYQQVQEGLPVIRVGAAVTTPLNSLVALADGPVKSIPDLKGKTIGYSIAGFEEALLSTMLAEAGLKLADVKLVNINFALTPALLNGQVDAVIGAFRNFELTELKLAGKPGRAFYPEEHGVPPYDELIYIVKQDRAADPKVTRFLDAVERATFSILNDPDGAWASFVKANPKLDDELNKTAWTDTLKRLASSPAALDGVRYSRFAQFMKDRGLIDAMQPVSRYAVAR
ncbi:ABC transporter ATP-binding protein [Alsobacter metallidurans]|uniref:ABC transporter ATP-binding protein n=1 Tax=Alsobacter metallidurans TaxID=340221 RepID=A0A917I2K3_9HYPH|nr:ABC transporter substrate-binding protein [Alsobacter metallidurans]GGH06989.1 ABC transporter ATP-binding protein [Alsobacter metallidurans]